jgi:CheY-like chemotaxis protein
MDTPQQFKVLVADDSPPYRKLVEQALSHERYSVLFANNGRQAVDLFSEHHPPLVITDWMMPDISGIELSRRLLDQALSC